ncbi:O-antigen ligase family protein [Leucobacter sp. CSA1]|uniref:O-antigen ligase family protein n=1 Tax=Leucobacter chromiisoli TaxID=2796471 RepID=A0A934UU10_9MICO|nr:O-antigen ligase family protein [Leucobacter chromiisoli]MBK0417693.1 O-antigen ligase family protein [Leucobacter chromiisoli]
MAESRTRLGVSAYAICVFVFALGSNGVRNLVGWPAFLALALLIASVGVVLAVRLRPERFRWYRLPSPLYWFLALAALSILWSAYRLESALGVLAQLVTTAVAVSLAAVLTWHEVLRTLGSALRYLIGLSVAFELWVALVVQAPLLPWWLEAPDGETPKLLYWSRDLLLSGGPVQGLVGSSVILGFIGLLGLIVFGIQLRAGLVRRFAGWFWVTMSLLTLLLTRGATVTVALAAVFVGLGFALWARRIGQERRMPLYALGAGIAAAAALLAVFARDFLFGLLGKSGDMTGRLETWQKVVELAQQRPWFGWGWISYWAPWVEPYASLDEKAGLQVMSAHNAWLDVWLQLGIVGVLVFAPLVVLTLWRTWFRAVDQPRRGPGPALPYATSALWPFLVMIALLVQSLTESRLLIEWGWLLLVMLAVKTRIDFELPSQDAEPRKLPWRRVPIPREAHAETAGAGATAPAETVSGAGA